MKKRVKRYLTDAVGVCLILASPLLGWLPGPGGIPLFIAGLALLAMNNKWAEDFLTYIKDRGEDFAKIIFPASKKYQFLHDGLAISLLIISVTLFILTASIFYKAISCGLLILAITEFIYNRNRIAKFKQLIISIQKNILAFFRNLF